jgi:hypothetical protein
MVSSRPIMRANFVRVVGAAALVGAFIGAITGALQVLLRNRDSDSDMVEQRLPTIAMCCGIRPRQGRFLAVNVGSTVSL